MAPFQMDISFILNDDESSSSNSNSISDRFYASQKEEIAAKGARDGTISPQALRDIVQLATGSSKIRESAFSPVKKRRPRRCTEVYRINKDMGRIERREDMDPLIKLVAETYEPGKKVRRFLCFCDKWYNKREHLNRHVQLVHLGHRPFRCDSCKVSFGTKQNMDVHLNTNKHKRIEEKK